MIVDALLELVLGLMVVAIPPVSVLGWRRFRAWRDRKRIRR
jgi:hypothetical protein